MKDIQNLASVLASNSQGLLFSINYLGVSTEEIFFLILSKLTLIIGTEKWSKEVRRYEEIIEPSKKTMKNVTLA